MAFATENLIDSCKRVSTNKARCKDTNLFSIRKWFSVFYFIFCEFLTHNSILVTYIKL
nr:MAG TPA_asm: hypothetical protein [Caudoviricetes sp.]